MGQIQSDIHHKEEEHDDHVGDDNRKNSVDTPYSSMDALVAEATAMGGDESESLDVKAQKALECPCVAELRDGPCGEAFTEAFVCFIKSQAEEKTRKCVGSMKANHEENLYKRSSSLVTGRRKELRIIIIIIMLGQLLRICWCDWWTLHKFRNSLLLQNYTNLLLRRAEVRGPIKAVLKSQTQGSDCVSPFIALQKCIQENKDAFAKYDLDDNDTEDGENAQEDKGSAVLSSEAGEHKISP